MFDDFRFSELIEIFRNSVYITGLVVIMMLIIEYVNVATKGRRLGDIQKSPLKQVILGAALGLIPGCMGGFVAVSLFSHNIFGLGGLVAAMISDTGDETFVMFAAMPGYALLIKLLTFVLAIAAGFAINAFMNKNNVVPKYFDHNLEIHSLHGSHSEQATSNIWRNIRRPSLARIVILLGIVGFMLSLGLGLLEHKHSVEDVTCIHANEISINEHEYAHEHEHEHEHEYEHEHAHEHEHARHEVHSHSHGNIFSERWLNILFVFIAGAAFLMVLSVTEHFLREHVLRHVIYRHLLRVFTWTFGSLLAIYLLGFFVHYDEWMNDNQLIMLFIALTIGLIPESGPHIVFISLFLEGNIPFSILLANSLVQNGHSGLPLLAESKKGFVKMKLIALTVGLITGLLGYAAGF
ncbi:MAG: putative manganese transporter [Prevotellaceae bacterium]|jgi:ABC-type multidrug transport system fused ATPase/permease subunit|nr:putative manganese transporter [Prevotellaceae bacterium]